MSLYYEDRNQKLPETKNREARKLLSTLKDQRMIPTLRRVPITESLPDIPNDLFKAQEKEDKFLYEHFFNEHTKKCHAFGDKLFESGAFKGVALSNTFFFEKHFNLSTTLVEADDDNWKDLIELVPKYRKLADYHKGALCPLGTHSICMKKGNFAPMNSVDFSRMDCENSIPCFDFDDSIHYAFFSLDIEGVELAFLKMRNPKADILLIEVIQWARKLNELIIAVELVAYLAEHGYYLYEETIGFRNFLFVSQDLVNDCFAQYKSE